MKNDGLVKYPLSMRIYHWVVFLLVIILITVGYVMSDMGVSEKKWQIYFMHKSFGLTLFLIVLARIINRLRSKIAPLPKTISLFDVKVASIVHFMLYVLLIAMPISGMLMSIFGGRGLPFFFVTFLSYINRQEEVSGFFWLIHTKLPVIMIILIILHVLGSFKHLLIDKVNIFKRIF